MDLPGDLLKANHVDLERFGKGTVGDPGTQINIVRRTFQKGGL